MALPTDALTYSLFIATAATVGGGLMMLLVMGLAAMSVRVERRWGTVPWVVTLYGLLFVVCFVAAFVATLWGVG